MVRINDYWKIILTFLFPCDFPPTIANQNPTVETTTFSTSSSSSFETNESLPEHIVEVNKLKKIFH